MPKPPPRAQPSKSLSPPPTRRRGRTLKAPEALQRHLVACRLTDAELAQLDLGRGVLTRGEGLRQLALARRLPPGIPEVNRQAYAELARASANLNQLSRRANIEGQLEIAALSAALAAFRLSLLGVTPATLDAAEAEGTEEGDQEESEKDDDKPGENVDGTTPGEPGAEGLDDPTPGQAPP